MIKKIIKTSLIILIILVLAILYLSIFGIKTDKFNNQITSNILKINKKIDLGLGDVNYLLNPYNFTINIKTKNPKILIEGKNLAIKNIQTNISLKSLFDDQFSVKDLKIITKEIQLKDIVAISRLLKNSQELFILDSIIKDGFVTANINLKFDDKGNIKNDYTITGSVKKIRFNILNKFKSQNLNFNFNINKNIYLLEQINMDFNGIKITSPIIEVYEKKDSFFVNGQFSNEKNNFEINKLKSIFVNLLNDIDIQKIEFSSKNNFSFSINKNLKLNNFKIKTVIDLNQLIFSKKELKLKPYLPSFNKEVKLEKHKIIINYNKKKIDINGNGNILLKEKSDNLSYQIIKDKKNILFDFQINFKNNSFLLDFLDYKKEEGLDSLISIKGSLNNNNQLNLDLINLKENNNEISIKNLELSESFKVIDIKSFNINYENNNKIFNNLQLKKKNSNFIIEGENFDASKIIDNFMDNEEKNLSIFDNLNSMINIKIDKTYIDKTNYINNLYGNVKYNNNKIANLKLKSTFPNKKKINLSIETKDNSETITKLFSAHPKPLVKRYNFIKGFEEGTLDFYSSKKGDLSNSVLVIDDFKVKEVPIFAKLLSLASLQGMADLLTGEGIRFTDFEMSFSNQNGLTKIDEMYAIGPAVSILMDGYVETKKLVSLRGTLVPATTINRSIASIPLLGKILIGDKTGEGVFGVSFKIKGPPKDLKTSVNPIKTLTPRFITRTLEKIKKN
jgi:hypothetical protein